MGVLQNNPKSKAGGREKETLMNHFQSLLNKNLKTFIYLLFTLSPGSFRSDTLKK
jgi:hypothetical protein